jgi:protein-tyrosine sulfotransferase
MPEALVNQLSVSSEYGMSKFTAQGPEKAPVYIMTPMQRCGTNHLADLLMLHPDFQLPKVLEEDFVFEHADVLYEYGERMYQRWKKLKWIDNPEECRRLLQLYLGQGLLSFLRNEIDGNKRLLLKTPDCNNIDKFFLFFPGANLVILIRDGRDVVESAVRKWPKQSDEHWMREWAAGCRRILNFMEGVGRGSRGKSWELVRYEDLVERPEASIKGIADFLGVDEVAVDWDRLTKLPVRGSSVIVDAQGRVSGATVKKPSDFSSIGRWRDWSMWRKRRFKKVAGRELVEMGYEPNDRW